MTDDRSSGGAVRAVIALLVVGALVGGGVYFLKKKDGGGGVDPANLTDAQKARLLELRNVGIGHLENEKFEDAEQAFIQIINLLPNDPLGHRNLAVSRLMAFKAERKTTSSADVEAAIRKLRSVEDQSAIPHYLYARLYLLLTERALSDEALRNQNAKKTLEALEKAAKFASTDSAILYAPVKISTLTWQGDGADPMALNALQRAYTAAPDNLFLLREWMKAQAEAEDAEVLKTFEQAKKMLGPFTDGIRKRARINVLDTLDQAIEAVGKEDWRTAKGRMRFVYNASSGEQAAKADSKRVDPHLLEFVIHKFADPILPPGAPSADPTSVKLALFPADRQPPEATDVHDVMLADFDSDGGLDLIVLNEKRLDVLQRDANGGAWKATVGYDLPEGMTGMVAADLDQDDVAPSGNAKKTTSKKSDDKAGKKKVAISGADSCVSADIDFVIYGKSGIVVLRNDLNEEGRVLVEVPQKEATQKLQDVTSATLIDFDHDGDLDLVASSSTGIFLGSCLGVKGKHDPVFNDLAQWSQLPPAETKFTSMQVVDFDRDVDLDIVITGPNAAGYLENQRHSQFRWREFNKDFDAVPARRKSPDNTDFDAAFSSAQSAVIMETDGNVSWDVALGGANGIQVAQTSTPLPGSIKLERNLEVDKRTCDSLLAWDFDNDGWQDLLATTDQGIVAFRASGIGFDEAKGLFANPPTDASDLDIGDLDDDGDLDVAVVTAKGIVLYENQGGNENHWLAMQLKGKEDNMSGRVNCTGLGSLLEVKTGSLYQAQVSSRQVTHFGLGQQPKADVVRLLMTNGIPQDKIQPERNAMFCEVMSTKGSCPYIYTWDGEQFAFFSDCLWAAPIGLQFADGVIAPARAWEYLKLPGEMLKPKDGRYWIRVTEELWEAAYFDKIELIAVDHPADVEIFSNEKVGPAEIAEPMVHLARNPRLPVAARDKFDRDVMSFIKDRDDVYMKGFEKRFCQGFTEEHYLELDLGKLQEDGADKPERITLFLTGWIFPSDTSLNVGISEQPGLGSPRPPFLLTPDENGEWREASPYIGFPSGKTKTIAIDVTDAFSSNDYRLRVVTSQQIYWDAAFFTVDESPVKVDAKSDQIKWTRISPNAADLQYRGFSKPVPQRENVPERYDYDKVTIVPKWAPMQGRFTRYGDVLSLMTKTDDQLAVIGAGDEIQMSFPVPEAKLPEGWKRDFLLHCVGWDKDADLNTVYGQSSEPLPFQAMDRYPYEPLQAYPDSKQLKTYLETYQTREQQPREFWRRLQSSKN